MFVKMELVPFSVPEQVYVKQPPGKRQDGFKAAVGIPLKDLDAETLAGLVDEFRANVFAKAGIDFQNPRSVADEKNTELNQFYTNHRSP